MRHAHFRVGLLERDRWYEHMTAALDEKEIEIEVHRQMLEYFSMAANHLVNTTD
jgi:truncated hemoglobin YjbI|tara:strand:- start:7727 stop:7888 length:162 start_codon:yes stop_codon:yes gene_type:complete